MRSDVEGRVFDVLSTFASLYLGNVSLITSETGQSSERPDSFAAQSVHRFETSAIWRRRVPTDGPKYQSPPWSNNIDLLNGVEQDVFTQGLFVFVSPPFREGT